MAGGGLLLLLLVPPCLSQYKIVRHNPFAGLAATLAPHTAAACDHTVLSLSCPGGTRVSITAVQYGPAAACPGPVTNSSCSLPHGPLLRVQAACQSRPGCSLPVSPQSLAPGAEDGCPAAARLARVSYHCRPASFRSAVRCIGGGAQPRLTLACADPATRILVFAAAFVGAGGGAVYCPAEGKEPGAGSWRDGAMAGRLAACEGELVTRPVTQACHGQANCSISALPAALGAPACAGLHVYIKTTYACVPTGVIREELVDRTTTITTTGTTTTTTTTTTSTTSSTTTTTTTRETTTTEQPTSRRPPSTPSVSTAQVVRESQHWAVLSNHLNLDILPLEQERREDSPRHQQVEPGEPGLVLGLVVGLATAGLLLAAATLLTARCLRRARRPARPPPSPSYQAGPDYQLSPCPALPLPEPALFAPPAIGHHRGTAQYSTVGRPRCATVRPLSSSSGLPPELRLGWPPREAGPRDPGQGEASPPRVLATVSGTVAGRRHLDWPFYG